MDLNHYSFKSIWQVDSPPEDAYLALETLRDYPAWWPEVREVHRIDDERSSGGPAEPTPRYRLRCRSLLPYDLTFITEQSRRDPAAGVLEARMEGDLEGFSRWTIEEIPGGARLTFDEEVIANRGLLRKLAFVARPAFKANHLVMMHHGREGLKTYLAGYRLARSQP